MAGRPTRPEKPNPIFLKNAYLTKHKPPLINQSKGVIFMKIFYSHTKKSAHLVLKFFVIILNKTLGDNHVILQQVLKMKYHLYQ